jgi:multidrug efflux pump subunit AcrA (membrane-fusion protein)
VFALSGLVLVQTIRPVDGTATPGAAAVPPASDLDDVTELTIAHLTDPATELLVREGDRVYQGQLLARLHLHDAEAVRRQDQARALATERETARTLQATKVRQVEALVAAGLAPPGALAREQAALDHTDDALAQARRSVAHEVDEARRAAEVRAPVEGQVLLLRLPAIHGSEGTAQLRLLYRRPSTATHEAR